jgi:hypothetical protein
MQVYSIDEGLIFILWRPIVWPFHAVVPLSALLMFVQGIWSGASGF